ncbi:MAG: endolytic transglycosylase MltG [Deltaproteobacteria bacterium]|nr:endolytic transglycosylase MltG [Deltaproteobacteria bacterium]
MRRPAMSDPAPQPAPPPHRWSLARRLLGPLVVLASLVLIAAVFLFALWARTPTPHSKSPAVVDISKGAGLADIAAALEDAGVIGRPRLFVMLAFAAGAQGELRAGEYEFAEGGSPWEVLTILRSGRTKRHFVTLQEGWTVAQMADAIAGANLARRAELLALSGDPAFARALDLPGETLEGYCFPDTYAFTRGMSAGAILKRLVSRFREVYAEEKAAAGAEAGGDLSEHEIVTLASIVEKETGVPGERALIAAVFLNRLRLGMRLQSDPTVIYGIADFDGNLTREHLARPGPYNTYVRAGLPPGPIANPGRAALRGVLEPAPDDYLYFVSRNDGSHAFSRTLAEHNRAVRRYQKRPRAAPAPNAESRS